MKRSCSSEIEREVKEVLQTIGLDELSCRRVAHSLMKIEEEEKGDVDFKYTAVSADPLRSLIRTISRRSGLRKRTDRTESGLQADEEKGASMEAGHDIGLTPFLLRFGEGQEEVPNSRLLISALTIGFSYAVGGIIPLVPYFCFETVLHAFYASIGVTAATLVIFGIVKAYFTGSRIGWKGYTKSALATLAIGGMAAGSAYGISRAIEGSHA